MVVCIFGGGSYVFIFIIHSKIYLDIGETARNLIQFMNTIKDLHRIINMLVIIDYHLDSVSAK